MTIVSIKKIAIVVMMVIMVVVMVITVVVVMVALWPCKCGDDCWCSYGDLV